MTLELLRYYKHASADPEVVVQILALKPEDNVVVYYCPEQTRADSMAIDAFAKYYTPCQGPRTSWEAYFLSMAHLASTRATCDRKHVGCVVVRDRRVIATGYNGSPPGMSHCDDVGHDLVTLADGSVNCVRTTHAEHNAILQAAKDGISLAGAAMYVTTYPCWPCAKAILGAGINHLIIDADYNNDSRVAAALTGRVAITRIRAGKVVAGA